MSYYYYYYYNTAPPPASPPPYYPPEPTYYPPPAYEPPPYIPEPPPYIPEPPPYGGDSYAPEPEFYPGDVSYSPDTTYNPETGTYTPEYAAPDLYADPFALEQAQSDYLSPQEYNALQEDTYSQGLEGLEGLEGSAYDQMQGADPAYDQMQKSQEELSGVEYENPNVSNAGQTRGMQSVDGVQYADALKAMSGPDDVVSDSYQNNMKLAEASPNFTPVEGGATSNASGSNISFNADGSASVITPSGARVDLSADQAQALLAGGSMPATTTSNDGSSEQFGGTSVISKEDGLTSKELGGSDSDVPWSDSSYKGKTPEQLASEENARLYPPETATRLSDYPDYKPMESTKGYWDEDKNVWVPSEYGTDKEDFEGSGTGELKNSWYDKDTDTYHFIDENGKEQTYKSDVKPSFEPKTGKQVMDKAEKSFTPQLSMKGGSGRSGGGGGGGKGSGGSSSGAGTALAALLAAYAASRMGGSGNSPAVSQAGIPSLALQRQLAEQDKKRRSGSSAQSYYKGSGYTAKAEGGYIDAFAGGGIAALPSPLGGYSDGGRLLKGPGDGVSDSIPATIGKKQPARLADGEFVIPARIVSELGNGSTEAGARRLYEMMDRVQKARRSTTGKNDVAKTTNARKLLPK